MSEDTSGSLEMIPASPTKTLFCVVGRDYYSFDMGAAVERHVESCFVEQSPYTLMIEEWATYPPSHHLPTTECILDFIFDWVCENGEIDEGLTDEWEQACADGMAKSMVEATKRSICYKVNSRMAKWVIKTHTVQIVVDSEGELVGWKLILTQSHEGSDK